ncbi:MAG TPA: MFS transporter [Pseudonocardiaceae bacterium]
MTTAGGPTITSTVRSLTLPVWVLMLGTLVNTVGSFLLLFLTLYLTNKGFTPFVAGLALGAWGVGRIVGAFIGGVVADRIGYRATMALSMLTTAVFIVGLVVAAGQGNAWLVVAASLVAASLGGIWRPPAQALLTELTPRDRLVTVTAIYRLAFNAGMLVSPLLGAVLSRISWDLLFWVEAASSAVFGLLVLALLPPDRKQATAPAGDPVTGTAAGPAPGYGVVLRDRTFVLFLGALVLNAVVYIQAPAVLSLHLDSLGHPATVFGALASLNALMVILLEVPFTRVTQRFQARTTIAAGMALTGIGLSFYSLPLGIAGFVLATVVWTMGEVVASPSMLAYPGLVAPPALRGRYIAAATVAHQAGYSIGPVVGTAVWAGLGGGVFWIAGAVSAVAVAAILGSVRMVDTAPESVRDGEVTNATNVTESTGPADAVAPEKS